MKPLSRRLATALGTLVLTLLTLVSALWLWSDSDTSLVTALRWLPRALPAGQQLSLEGVSGSLRSGGHLDTVHWQRDGLTVLARDVSVRWQPQALLSGELRLLQATVDQLRIEDQRTPSANTPAPPTQLGLPFKVNAQVAVHTLEWVGSTTQRVEQLSFSYIFDSYYHIFNKGQGLFSSNKYNFSGTLQASGPLALALQASGIVTTPVPGRAQPLDVSVQASLTGQLAGRDARLALQADLTPPAPYPPYPPYPPPYPPQASAPAAPNGQPTLSAMRASVSAQLTPWQRQPIHSGQARWQALNLAALWSQAPQTLLSGEASVSPVEAGWQASVQVNNSLSGPWDQHRLPLQRLQAKLGFADGRWLLHALQAQGAGGSLTASAQITPSVLWQMKTDIQGIQPAAIDTRLAGAALNGTLSARQALSPSVQPSAAPLTFELALQADAQDKRATDAKPLSASLQALRLHNVRAQGVWSTPLLILHSVQVNAQEAMLQGQFSYQTVSQAMQGQLKLDLPGLHAAVNGSISRNDGQGTLSLQLQDAALAARWFSRWPQLAGVLGGKQVRGIADLSASWQGGWQHAARALQVQAKLRATQLGWTSASNDVSARNMQLDLTGTPAHFNLTSQGQALASGQTVDWQTQADGARAVNGTWSASVRQLQLTRRDGTTNAPWTLTLGNPVGAGNPPVTLGWQPGSTGGVLTIAPGQAQLLSPLSGHADISWQAARWTASAWQSRGRIDNLPVGWLDAMQRKSLSDLGLSTDMLLSGDWEASQSPTLRARLTLERSGGDLLLHTSASGPSSIAAGMQEAWLQIILDGEQVAGSLRWDSARAGKALLAFSTQLHSKASAAAWSGDSPVAGSLQLELPPMDAWSALAPPGWRLRGTVNTHISLSGTLNLPQWDGSLQARDLALRSAVDGIDFSQGSLDARLHGQQLDITSFTLRGAGASAANTEGGLLSIGGNVFWVPQAKSTALGQQFQMTLQAQLRALRLSTRPDRRMVASGKLSAQLKEAKLTVRGTLTADQALFTLPDDNTPSLGTDVVVRQPARKSAAQPAKSRSANPLAKDIVLDLNMGPDFRVRGRGLTSQLAGQVTLSAKDDNAPALRGAILTTEGTYQAYGQRLVIEHGVIRFFGPVDNPALDILALRPKLSQRVGVQISGTALSPVVTLYAEPDLPDVEKLAWLVLGRSTSGGGAEAALMQQAAVALLGGNGKSLSDSMSGALGLDELSFRGGTETASSTGTASGASVTLGKRLSNDFYVAYEHSLNGTMGVFSIFYDLSKRLTLRAQTGEQSAVDLIFTLRYD